MSNTNTPFANKPYLAHIDMTQYQIPVSSEKPIADPHAFDGDRGVQRMERQPGVFTSGDIGGRALRAAQEITKDPIDARAQLQQVLRDGAFSADDATALLATYDTMHGKGKH